MRIDAHTHDWLCHEDIADPNAYIEKCAKNGVDRIVLIATPAGRGISIDNFDVVERFGDFVIPVLRVDADNEGPDQVHRCFDRGAAGVKFISPALPYSHEKYHLFYQAIKERDGVAVFHTGYLLHKPDYDPMYRGCMDHMRPDHIDAIQRWVPHLKVLMSHFGSPYWDECATIISRHPTVYADLSGGLAPKRSMLFWRETFAPNSELEEKLLDKVCFATDAGFFREGGEFDPRIQSYIDFYERLFDEVGASKELREKVNAGNVLELFGKN